MPADYPSYFKRRLGGSVLSFLGLICPCYVRGHPPAMHSLWFVNACVYEIATMLSMVVYHFTFPPAVCWNSSCSICSPAVGMVKLL